MDLGVVPGTSTLLLAVESVLAARGLAFATPDSDLSLGLGSASAVTGLVVTLKSSDLVLAALALRLAGRGGALVSEGEVPLTPIVSDLDAVFEESPCFKYLE